MVARGGIHGTPSGYSTLSTALKNAHANKPYALRDMQRELDDERVAHNSHIRPKNNPKGWRNDSFGSGMSDSGSS